MGCNVSPQKSQSKMKRRNLVNSKTSHAINRLDRPNSEMPRISSKQLNIGFVLRNAHLTPDEFCKIYIVLCYGSRRRLAYSSGLSCKPADFNSETGIIKGNPDATRLLAAMKTKASECGSDMRLTGRAIDLQIIKAYSLDIEIEGIPTVTECFDRFWNEVIQVQLKVGDIEPSTCRRLKAWQGHLLSFVLVRYGNRVALSTVTPADAQACLLWLRENKGHSNDVAMRIVSHFKRVLDFAVASEWIQRNPFMMFRKKMENKRQESLTIKEVEAIQNVKFASDVLDQVRDIFLFSCYTGLAYMEGSKLTPAHITDINGQHCIIQVRDKIRKRTNLPSIVPLGTEASEILERYRTHPVCLKKGVCLPVQANQRVNAYLKQIQQVAGIKKRLTTHTARRTFSTYYLNAGMPLTSVSAMLGHSDTATTTRHYTTVNPETVVRDFQSIRDNKTKNG